MIYYPDALIDQWIMDDVNQRGGERFGVASGLEGVPEHT
jgi:hypothetical protein